MSAIAIDIVSDTVCPWCYIGTRLREAALRERPAIAVDLRWHPYQLAPDLPAEGLARDAYLAAKFGSLAAARDIFGRIADAGRGAGLDFRFDRIRRAPNTLDSHRLILWAGSAGCQDAVVEDLFRSYFLDGQDIGDPAVLVGIAARQGMDRELVAELLAGDRDRDRVAREAAAARQAGISGVPTFIIGQRYAVAGAQDAAAFVEIFDRLAAGHRTPSTVSPG
ncbi:MAG: DsbA family oxidoreductase [Rhodothalassiaceae bacterium]